VSPGLAHVVARIDALTDSIAVFVQASPAFALAPRYRLAAIGGTPTPTVYASDSARSYAYVGGSFEFSSDTAAQLLTRTDSTFDSGVAVTSTVGQHGLYLLSGRTVLLLSRLQDGVSDSLYVVGDTLVREIPAGYGDTWYLGPPVVLRFQFVPDDGTSPPPPSPSLAPSRARPAADAADAAEWRRRGRHAAPSTTSPARRPSGDPPRD
jgi:hypothetical protein